MECIKTIELILAKTKKIMNKFSEKSWSISIGLYTGILLGFRAYEEEYYTTYVLYLPFVDIALEIDN